MTEVLQRLILEATGEVMRHGCEVDGHAWVAEGGRSCPMGADGCSQAVYLCRTCGAYDYGGEGGPGEIDCKSVCGDSMMGWRNGPLDPNPERGWLDNDLTSQPAS